MKSNIIYSFKSLRERISGFVLARSWTRYHTPSNLLLALSGECGELCEIFQWKGAVKGLEGFSESERVHVGEEMADVFIYCTRLSDVCQFDLARAAHFTLQIWPDNSSLEKVVDKVVNVNPSEWYDLDFQTVDQELNVKFLTRFNITQQESPREIALRIQSEVGGACNIFTSASDFESGPLGGKWPSTKILDLSMKIASICILLCYMAKICNISISSCISDKIEKNERKYPVHLAKGSAAKYTVYQGILSRQLENAKLALMLTVGLAVGYLLAHFFPYKPLDILFK